MSYVSYTQTNDYDMSGTLPRVFRTLQRLFRKMTICSCKNYFRTSIGFSSMISPVPLSKARCAVKCIRRRAQAVFLMFIGSTWLWGQTLKTNQQNPLYNHLIPSQCQGNTRCAEASTQWV
jgi:hypothetical protein